MINIHKFSQLDILKIFYLQKCQNRETVHNIQKFCLDKQIKSFWSSRLGIFQSDFRKFQGIWDLDRGLYVDPNQPQVIT